MNTWLGHIKQVLGTKHPSPFQLLASFLGMNWVDRWQGYRDCGAAHWAPSLPADGAGWVNALGFFSRLCCQKQRWGMEGFESMWPRGILFWAHSVSCQAHLWGRIFFLQNFRVLYRNKRLVVSPNTNTWEFETKCKNPRGYGFLPVCSLVGLSFFLNLIKPFFLY